MPESSASPTTPAVMVNLGSGPSGPSHWYNYDRSPTMLVGRIPFVQTTLHRLGLIGENHLVRWDPRIIRRDLTKPLPFTAGSVDAIYSSHFLEHVFMADAQNILNESFRVLRPGGVLRLALPDGTLWARELIEAGDDSTGEAGRRYQSRIGAHPEARPRGKQRITFRLGGHVHKWQPTRGLVHAMLREAGFTDIADRTYLEGELPELDLVETRPESFFVEATR